MAPEIRSTTVRDGFALFWDGPFSQWDYSPFTIAGQRYNCAEQFMMASKAQLFGDVEAREAIMLAANPSAQKAIGKCVRGFNKVRWEQDAKLYVYRASRAKYEQNGEHLAALKASIGLVIVEASPYDPIWGIGLGVEDPRAVDQAQWQGTNWLGQILTDLRIDLFGH